jgi:hypothetical protein
MSIYSKDIIDSKNMRKILQLKIMKKLNYIIAVDNCTFNFSIS